MANIVQVIIRGTDQFSSMLGRATKDWASFGKVGAAAGLTQQAINTADQMGIMAQRAGVAVDQFSKLAYAGKLAEVSQEDLVKASKAWSVEAAKGKSITGDFIGDLIAMADAFANTADGAGKVAFAVDKFGRSGQAMIPLLNQGSAALREQFDEAQKFGQVIGGDFARNADTFNDNLDRMKSLFTGIWLQVADRILPVLVAYSEALIDLDGQD